GEAIGIGGGAEGFASKNAGGLMIAVSIARRAVEAADDDIGLKFADDANDVGQGDIVAVPLLKSFVGGFGEAEVGDAGEALLHAVIFVGFQQLQGTQNSEFVGEIAAHFVLPAF